MRDQLVVGIDLGTTHSAVAYVEGGRPQLIPSRHGGRLTPSMVGFTPTGERVVGARARQLAETAPESVAYATKRFLGQRFSPELAARARTLVPYALVGGPQGEVRVKLAGRTLPLTHVAAMVLGELKLDAEAHFGQPVSRAVITVPANFDDTQRQATREAAAIAGLDVLRLVNEPTAAALAYGLEQGFGGRALVFDLGGGTFDVSVLEVQGGTFEVRATGGDVQLGGEDFDARIAQWLLAQVPEHAREAVAQDRVSLQRLKVAAERAKRTLTDAEEAPVLLERLGEGGLNQPVTLDTVLTRAFFEVLSEPLSRRCLAVCERTMAEAGLAPHAVDAVLLVGGMTRVPLVRRLVEQFFGRAPAPGVHPDEAVALGAALHAASLHRPDADVLLMDVASHSLGVGTAGGRMRRLIAKNTSVPVVARELFVPARSGQTEARIPVFQGEDAFAEGNRKLGELVLRELTGGERADTPIEVTFQLSSEGTLSVRAQDTTTGLAVAATLEARPSLQPPEARALAAEERAWAETAGAGDAARAKDALARLLERGQQALAVLQGAAREVPGPEAQAALDALQELLDQGEVALHTGDRADVARVARGLHRLLARR